MPSDASERAAEIRFLTLDEVLAIHEMILDRFGGPRGVRDLGLVESALFRPRSGYYDTLTEAAAALLHSLLINHGFIDGNKRVAFFATDVFLRMNGRKLEVDADEAHAFLIGLLEKGIAELAVLTRWIEEHAREL